MTDSDLGPDLALKALHVLHTAITASISSSKKKRKSSFPNAPIPSSQTIALLNQIPSPPLFVTFESRSLASSSSSSSYNLRGCIGSLSPFPRTLLSQIESYAITASQRDPRFSPIETLSELECCRVTVSILTEEEPASSWDDWTIGTHGVTIRFLANSDEADSILSSTYLPDVIPEQNWSQLETITSLVLKAGFSGQGDGGTSAKNGRSFRISPKWMSSHRLKVFTYMSKKSGPVTFAAYVIAVDSV